MGKGELWDPADQKPLNRSTPNLIHVITSWVPITKQNLDAIRTGVSSPHIREIYTLCSHVYYPFFCFSWFFQSPTAKTPAQIDVNNDKKIILTGQAKSDGSKKQVAAAEDDACKDDVFVVRLDMFHSNRMPSTEYNHRLL